MENINGCKCHSQHQIGHCSPEQSSSLVCSYVVLQKRIVVNGQFCAPFMNEIVYCILWYKQLLCMMCFRKLCH